MTCHLPPSRSALGWTGAVLCLPSCSPEPSRREHAPARVLPAGPERGQATSVLLTGAGGVLPRPRTERGSRPRGASAFPGSTARSSAEAGAPPRPGGEPPLRFPPRCPAAPRSAEVRRGGGAAGPGRAGRRRQRHLSTAGTGGGAARRGGAAPLKGPAGPRCHPRPPRGAERGDGGDMGEPQRTARAGTGPGARRAGRWRQQQPRPGAALWAAGRGRPRHARG